MSEYAFSCDCYFSYGFLVGLFMEQEDLRGKIQKHFSFNDRLKHTGFK